MKGFTTKALHTKFLKKDQHGSLHIPIYDNLTFKFDSSDELELSFLDKKPFHTYGRISNPTVENFEQKIKNITNSTRVISLSSEMVAISNFILTTASCDDNIITTQHLFGNTLSLFEKTLNPLGLHVKYADFTNPENIEKLIDEKTRAIYYFETITNPQLEVADIKKISDIAKKPNILTVVDSTLTPLYFCNSKSFVVDIEIISSTKYISGGATSVGGLIIDNGVFNCSNIPKFKDDSAKFGPFTLFSRLRRERYRNLGVCPSPNSAFLQSIELETLALRIEKSNKNCLKIAKFLSNNEEINYLNYPGLENSTYHKIAQKQFGNLFGGILTFDLVSKKDCPICGDNPTITELRDEEQPVCDLKHLNGNNNFLGEKYGNDGGNNCFFNISCA